MSTSAKPLPSSDRSRPPIFAVYLIFAVISFSLAYWKFATFRTNWPFDLANYEQVFYNVIHGIPLITMQPCNLMGCEGPETLTSVQFSLIRVFFLPFYRLVPGIPTILFLHTFIIAAGVIAAYAIARRRLPLDASPRLALLLSGLYVISPNVLCAFMNDFRPLNLSIPFFMLAIHYYGERDMRRFLPFCLAALTARQEIAAAIFFLPLADWRRLGGGVKSFLWPWVALPVLLSVGWVLLYGTVIDEAYVRNFVGYLLDTLRGGGESGPVGPSIVVTFYQVILGLAHHYGLYLVLALLSPAVLLMAFPYLLYFIFVLGEVPGPTSLQASYLGPVTAIVFMSAFTTILRGVTRLGAKGRSLKPWISVLFAYALLHFGYGLAVQLTVKPAVAGDESAALKTLFWSIPEDASVVTDFHLCCHLSARAEIYVYDQLPEKEGFSPARTNLTNLTDEEVKELLAGLDPDIALIRKPDTLILSIFEEDKSYIPVGETESYRILVREEGLLRLPLPAGAG